MTDGRRETALDADIRKPPTERRDMPITPQVKAGLEAWNAAPMGMAPLLPRPARGSSVLRTQCPNKENHHGR